MIRRRSTWGRPVQKGLTPVIRFWTGLILLVVIAAPARGDWRGRFDVGGSPVFYDDSTLEDRTPLTARLQFRYQVDDDSPWLFQSNIRLRSEMNSKDGNAWRIRDLFVQYGSRTGATPWTVSAGVFNPDTLTGAGDVMGAGLQYTRGKTGPSRWGFNAFGGANAV
ncbi:MAG TPA: hypothetical protein PLV45_10790, partial [bacterium]|nr:hypothetical protein [bacterium]